MSERSIPLALSKRPMRRVFLLLCLTASYMIAEVIGGLLSNSLALLADAGHMFADVAALLISLIAIALAARPPSPRATFGYHRAEVLAALFNGVILLFVAFFIIKEAVSRLFITAEVESDLMILVAIGGLLINAIGLYLLHRDKSKNLNIRGAWLHVLSDTLSSIAVIFSGLMIRIFDWRLADPIASIAIALLVSYSAVHLIFETLRILMEHTPKHIDPNDVIEEILSIPAAKRVKDLHIWTITSGREALSAHVVAENDSDHDMLLREIQNILQARFSLSHATIQIEKVSGEK